MNTETTVSLLVEVPEVLHESMRQYLEQKKDWDQDRVMSAALSLFLLQNSAEPEELNHRQAARIYLDQMFKQPIQKSA